MKELFSQCLSNAMLIHHELLDEVGHLRSVNHAVLGVVVVPEEFVDLVQAW